MLLLEEDPFESSAFTCVNGLPVLVVVQVVVEAAAAEEEDEAANRQLRPSLTSEVVRSQSEVSAERRFKIVSIPCGLLEP